MCYNKQFISQLLENNKKQATLFYALNSIVSIGFLINGFIDNFDIHCLINTILLSVSMTLSGLMTFRYKLQIPLWLKRTVCSALMACSFGSFLLIVPSQLFLDDKSLASDIIIYFALNAYIIINLLILHRKYRILNNEWKNDKRAEERI